MNYNVVLTTAEDIVAVVDAVVAKGNGATIDFVADFTGIATDDQVMKALQMSVELDLLSYNNNTSCYETKSFLARKLVSAASDNQKAAIMRLILEQYTPYKTFKTRYSFTKSIDIACKQTKSLHSIRSNERDIKNTFISIATYAKALRSEGANLYSFAEDSDAENLIEYSLRTTSITEESLRDFWGENICEFVNTTNVFQPLSDALQKLKTNPIDARSVVVYSANAFESFLNDYANYKKVSLIGKNGIIEKGNALSVSKKHKGLIGFIGQIRNAADHGADPDENNQIWTVSKETAMVFPCIVAIAIKDIYLRDNGIIEV